MDSGGGLIAGKGGGWATRFLWRAKPPAGFWSFRCVAILACLMALLSPGGLPALDTSGHGAFDSSALDLFLDSASSWVAPPGEQPHTGEDFDAGSGSHSRLHDNLIRHSADVISIGETRDLAGRLFEVQRE